MGEGDEKRLCYSLTLLQFLSIVNCSGYTFQRIDKNDDMSMAVGFTRHFHECSIDYDCNFVVKRSPGFEFEKMHNVDDVTTFYSVWEKQKIKQGR